MKDASKKHLLRIRRRDRKARHAAKMREITSYAYTTVEAGNVEPKDWESANSPRVSKVNQKKNKKFVDKLEVTGTKTPSGKEVYISHTDPQYKRQISIVDTPENPIPYKEPEYLAGRGDHRISDLGYAKIADRQGDLGIDVYLSPYDPNWKRSEEMMQQVVKHWVANHGNPDRIMPEPDATMFVGIKEEWEHIKKELFSEVALEKDENIEQHLKRRGLDPEQTKVILDVATNTAIFLLYNLSGKLIGYQQYYPSGSKKIDPNTDPKLAKYFTWISQEGDSRKSKALGVWGLESIDNRPFIFLTEGVFDAVKIHNEGLPAIAVLTNDPKHLRPWLKAMQKYIIVVADNDAPGRKLKKLGDLALTVPESYKDLGDMPQKKIKDWLHTVLPSKIVEGKVYSETLWESLKQY